MTYIVLTSDQWARLKATTERIGECAFAVSMAQPAIAAFGSPEHDMQLAVGEMEETSRTLAAFLAEVAASNDA